MTPRHRLWIVGGLAAAVVAGAIYFFPLRHRIKETARLQQQTEEQAKRDLALAQSIAAAPAAPAAKAKLFWASGNEDGSLAPVEVELPLSAEPALRAKQVLNTLLAGPVDAELRTLPPDAALLEFYLLPDGTGVADFSEALATSIPAGIASEQLAVDSITKTLEANVPQIRSLEILIHGQEVDTLAGHLDLTQPFTVGVPPVSAGAIPPSGRDSAETLQKPATPAGDAPEKLTPTTVPGTLTPPTAKP